MNYSTETARSVQIEWKYGLTTLIEMVGLEVPRGLRTEIIEGYADWSQRFNTGRVLQTAMPRNTTGIQEVDADWTPHYVRPGRSMLNWPVAKERYTVQEQPEGHPMVLDELGAVLQSEVYVDRLVRFVWANPDWSDPRPELIFDEITHHVSDTTFVDVTPFCFEVSNGEGGNTLATRIGYQMHDDDYRPATLTEMLWYAAKYEDEIGENQILVPWAGYSGGFAEGRQLGHHLGLPFVVRKNGVLRLTTKEFLGQWMSVDRGVKYLAVKM